MTKKPQESNALLDKNAMGSRDALMANPPLLCIQRE